MAVMNMELEQLNKMVVFIKKKMLEKKVKASELAFATGIPISTIYKRFDEPMTLKLEEFLKIKKALKFDLVELEKEIRK